MINNDLNLHYFCIHILFIFSDMCGLAAFPQLAPHSQAGPSKYQHSRLTTSQTQHLHMKALFKADLLASTSKIPCGGSQRISHTRTIPVPKKHSCLDLTLTFANQNPENDPGMCILKKFHKKLLLQRLLILMNDVQNRKKKKSKAAAKN